jgi:Carbohydrate binding module (family 6)
MNYTPQSTFRFFLVTLFFLILHSCQPLVNRAQSLSPYADTQYRKGRQSIPGKLQCEYFDFGGEGIAFHDSDTSNRGSGALNKGMDYLSTFRKNESVDISFTKFHNGADNSSFNLVQPEEKQLYVGWTEPGEWIKYSVDVKTSGTYVVGIMYTANDNGQISLSSNDEDISGLLNIPSTFDAADSVGWRQWHHWNYIKSIGEVQLKSGFQVITMTTVTKGQMNYDYLDFRLK